MTDDELLARVMRRILANEETSHTGGYIDLMRDHLILDGGWNVTEDEHAALYRAGARSYDEPSGGPVDEARNT